MLIVIPGKEELYNINLRLIEKLMKFLYQYTFKYVKNRLMPSNNFSKPNVQRIKQNFHQ